MAVEVLVADDASYIGIDLNPACQTPLNDTVASIAGVEEAAELEIAETLAAVEPSMIAGSGYIGSVQSDLYPWQRTAGKPLPWRPVLRVEDTVMAAVHFEERRIAEWSWWLTTPMFMRPQAFVGHRIDGCHRLYPVQ